MVFSFQNVFLLCAALIFFACGTDSTSSEKSAKPIASKPEYTIVIHGGAGTILKKNMTEEQDLSYRQALDSALTIGENILKNKGNAIDAVTKTINYLENNPLFNAGIGSVFTNEGNNEMDASIMVGANLEAGAVGGVSIVENPINLARAVMEKSPHVMLAGRGAERFAAENGISIVDPQHFYTERRWKSLQSIKNAKKGEKIDPDKKHGTVGCVALDVNGNIVAGTSTGGMTNKKWNRIGDSPVIGAGTYANNNTCGISATGHGEFFIRYTVAYDISAQMEYGQKTILEAAEYTVMNKLKKANGTGGIIGLDAFGNVAMVFNTEGMYRGFAKPNERKIAIYKNE